VPAEQVGVGACQALPASMARMLPVAAMLACKVRIYDHIAAQNLASKQEVPAKGVSCINWTPW
jgi:hypothetical protein